MNFLKKIRSMKIKNNTPFYLDEIKRISCDPMLSFNIPKYRVENESYVEKIIKYNEHHFLLIYHSLKNHYYLIYNTIDGKTHNVLVRHSK